MRSLLLLALASALAAGCTVTTDSAPNKPPPTSTTLATGDVWPSMSAQSDGQTLKVYAALLKGSDFVLLDGDESFTASVGTQTVILQREPYTNGGAIHYFATLAAPTVATDVAIAFHRTGGRTDAVSHVTVAAPFEVTSPAPPSFRIGSSLAVQISPPPAKGDAGDRTTLAFFGDCLADSSPRAIAFDAEGAGSFDTAQLVLKKGATGCDVSVMVRHETLGKSDATFNAADAHPVEGLVGRSFHTSIVH